MSVAPTPIEGNRGHHRRPLLVAAILVFLIAVILALLFRHDVFQGGSTSTGLQGSGVAATQTRAVPSFSGVELAGSNNVTIRVGERQSVVVKADDNLLDRVTTRVEAGNLVIGNTPGGFTAMSPTSVEVTVPSLAAVTLSGSGNCSVSGIKTQSLTVTITGSGVVTGSGTAGQLQVSLAGSGVAQLGQLVADDVRAVVSGSGDIFVTATKSLDGSVPGSGTILYGGDPQKVTTRVTGSGAISPL
jgi:Putative auto-transporter adhesin, head GIN domain